MAEPSTAPFESVPRVAEVALARGRRSPRGAPPDLLVEVPHGATRGSHFRSLRAELRGPFREDLEEYFFVNTDVGAPEVALRVAARVVAADDRRCAAVVRCLIPRTFVDCNRVIEPDAVPTASAAGAVTPGIASYVKDPADVALLLGRYAAYRGLVTRACEAVAGAGGTLLLLHSYAPRSVDVPVDERIVERLRDAYRPEVLPTWPLRAEVDLIVRDPEGRLLAPPALIAAMEAACRRAGLGTAQSGAYALHPATLAASFAARWPDRTLCVEMRRDLLVPEFVPFRELDVDPARADRLATVLAEGLRATLPPS